MKLRIKKWQETLQSQSNQSFIRQKYGPYQTSEAVETRRKPFKEMDEIFHVAENYRIRKLAITKA